VQLHIDSPGSPAELSAVFRASDPETLIDFIGAGAMLWLRGTVIGNVISPGP